MSEHEPFERFRQDLGTVRTPVEHVMARGRRIQRNRRLRHGALTISAVGAAAGVLLGTGVVGGGGHGRSQVVTSPPSPSRQRVADAAIPGSAGCAAPRLTTISGQGPTIGAAGIPQDLRVTSTSGQRSSNCAVPPVALLWSGTAADALGAVALWGPGATRSTETMNAAPQAVRVHGRSADLVVGVSNTVLSWQEADGSRWVLTNTSLDATELVQFANAIVFDATENPSSPTSASFGLKAEKAPTLPSAGTAATSWRTEYSGGGKNLVVTVMDNWTYPTGELLATFLKPSTLTFGDVRSHTAVVVDMHDRRTLVWSPTPSRTVTLQGDYSAAELLSIAGNLEIGL